jgi:hypothetical protein
MTFANGGLLSSLFMTYLHGYIAYRTCGPIGIHVPRGGGAASAACIA